MTLRSLLSPLLLLLSLLAAPAQASSQDLLSSLGIEASAQPKFLKVDEAFVLESEQQGNKLLLTLRLADGYYLYRHSISVKGDNLAFEPPVLPAGTEHEDDFFGKTRVFYQELQIPVTLTQVGDAASLKISYQGCTEGLCYPPTDKRIPVQPLAATGDAGQAGPADATEAPAASLSCFPSSMCRGWRSPTPCSGWWSPRRG